MKNRSLKISISETGMINIIISILVAAATYFSLALIARKFGGSAGSDAYFFLLSLTTLSTAVIVSVFSAVFLPVFIELKVRDSIDQASDFAGIVLSWSLIICLSFGIAAYIFHDIFFATVSKFDPSKLNAQKNILLCFAPIFFFSVIGEFFRLILIALGRYTTATLSGLLPPTILIAVLLLPEQPLQEVSLALSLWAGRAAVLLLALLILRETDIRLIFRLTTSPALKRFVRVSTPYGMAGLVTSIATFFSDYMATGLPAGVLTSVTYAQRIFSLPLSLVINPVLEIARTKFSEYRAQDDMKSFEKQYNLLSQLIIYFSLPIASIFFLFSTEIVVILFQRGAFSSTNVEISSASLRIFAISVPLSCLFTLNGRAVEIFQKLTWPSFFGTIGNIGLIFLTLKFVDLWGFIGIPFARLAVDFFYLLPFGFIAISLFGITIRTRALTLSFINSGLSCVISASAHLLLPIRNDEPASMSSILEIVSNITYFCTLYLFIIFLLDQRLRQFAIIIIRRRLNHRSRH